MDGPDGRVMHAELQIGKSKVFVADDFGGSGAHPPKANLHLDVPDSDKYERNTHSSHK